MLFMLSWHNLRLTKSLLNNLNSPSARSTSHPLFSSCTIDKSILVMYHCHACWVKGCKLSLDFKLLMRPACWIIPRSSLHSKVPSTANTSPFFHRGLTPSSNQIRFPEHINFHCLNGFKSSKSRILSLSTTALGMWVFLPLQLSILIQLLLSFGIVIPT